MNELTDKQAAFVREYLVDWNARQAAIRAGYSEKTAQEQSSRLLSKVKVQNAIAAAQVEISERNKVTIDSLLVELDEARRNALSDPKGASAAVSATLGKAKICGFLVDRKEVSGRDGKPIQISTPSASERLREFLASIQPVAEPNG